MKKKSQNTSKLRASRIFYVCRFTNYAFPYATCCVLAAPFISGYNISLSHCIFAIALQHANCKIAISLHIAKSHVFFFTCSVFSKLLSSPEFIYWCLWIFRVYLSFPNHFSNLDFIYFYVFGKHIGLDFISLQQWQWQEHQQYRAILLL